MGGDMPDGDGIAGHAGHAGQQRPGSLARQQMHAPVLQVAQARREAVAEEGHEAEHMIGCTAGVGVYQLVAREQCDLKISPVAA